MKYITVISFLVIIFGVFFLNITKSPDEFSASERRKLAQFPTFSLENVMNGKFMEGFNDYAVDQTAFREEFRRLKSFFDLNVLRKSDNNGIFVHNGFVFKTEYPLNRPSVIRLCEIINSVHEIFLDESNRVWYSVAPDKNAFISDSKYLVLDYDEMKTLIRENINQSIPYIEIFDTLELQAYYRTDSHWRQEYLLPVAQTLTHSMGVEFKQGSFTQERFDSFYGVYYGHSALNIAPDELIWLVSETTQNAIVTSAERPGRQQVYDISRLESVDPYNMFMCGPTPIVTARNRANSGGRNLIIFRDSFSSALSPLLLDSYHTVTLIDLRYTLPNQLNDVDFAGADVLFLYSTGLFNNAGIVRG